MGYQGEFHAELLTRVRFVACHERTLRRSLPALDHRAFSPCHVLGQAFAKIYERFIA